MAVFFILFFVMICWMYKNMSMEVVYLDNELFYAKNTKCYFWTKVDDLSYKQTKIYCNTLVTTIDCMKMQDLFVHTKSENESLLYL